MVEANTANGDGYGGSCVVPDVHQVEKLGLQTRSTKSTKQSLHTSCTGQVNCGNQSNAKCPDPSRERSRERSSACRSQRRHQIYKRLHLCRDSPTQVTLETCQLCGRPPLATPPFVRQVRKPSRLPSKMTYWR